MADDEAQSFNPRERVITVTALLALAGFALFVLYLLRNLSASELEWTRSIYLLSGVEAIVFAAAGYLFGRDVHRQRAEKAEERLDQAEGQAEIARQQASEAETKATEAVTKGKALATMVEKRSQSQRRKAPPAGTLGASKASPATDGDVEEIADYARSLFPES